ncbi:hypothetical protein Tco_0806043 [Tanacetum coccineum]
MTTPPPGHPRDGKIFTKWHNRTSRGRSTETSDGLAAIQAQLNNLGREIKKVNEKVYVAQVGCEQCKGPHYTKDCPLKKERKTLEEAYYTQFGGPFQGGGYRATAPGFYQRNNPNPSNQGASIKTLEIQIGQIRKVLQERGFRSLPSSTETNPRDQVKSISTTIEADSHPIRRIGSFQYAVSTGQNHTLMYETRQMTIPFPSRLNGYYCDEKMGSYRLQFWEAYSEALHIDNSIPQKEKDPGSFTLLCFINNVCFDNSLVDLGVSISVMPFSTYLNLGLGELAHTKLIVELAVRTVKYPKGIAENVLVEIEARLMGETLVINRPLDHLNGDYIGLNDLNEPFELRRNQGNNLKPTIEEGEVIKEFRTRDDKFDIKIDDYPILEDMNAYRDEGMGNVIVGEPFLREVEIKARRFEGTITLYKGDESVTYQMVRSHPRFKRHTNEQCNKIPPLLKVSEEDEINGISHPYQKLKGFYKGVLNLGPDYIRDAKMEE